MKIIRANCNMLNNTWQLGTGGLHFGATPIVRGDLYGLQFKAYSGVTPFDLSDYNTDALIGFKTLANYEAGTGDYATAFAGFDTGDPWHNLAIGQGTVLFVPNSQLDYYTRYYAGVILFNSYGSQMHLGNVPLLFDVEPPIRTGTESNVPAGAFNPTADTAIITGSNESVTVSLTNMTATGKVVVWPETSTAGFTTFTVGYGADVFTITVPAAPEIDQGGQVFNFGWQLVRFSNP
jgi:hypothetical protein